MVAAFNCCLPSSLAFSDNQPHSSEHESSCPAQEKPDLDAVHIGALKPSEEKQIHTPEPTYKTSKLYLSQENFQYQKNRQKTYHIDFTPLIWGYNSPVSSGVFRL